jgi:hypothetical protein
MIRSYEFEARAARSSYLVWTALFSPLCILSLVNLADGKLRGQEYVVLLPFGMLLGFLLWLSGFRIQLTESDLIYRDGLRRRHSCRRDAIVNARMGWMEFSRLGKPLQIPRLIIICSDNRSIIINTKPFARDAIKRLRQLLDPSTVKS